jgi:hypothetical protein
MSEPAKYQAAPRKVPLLTMTFMICVTAIIIATICNYASVLMLEMSQDFVREMKFRSFFEPKVEVPTTRSAPAQSGTNL